MALYRKYRPRTLERVKGNEQIVRTLNTMLEKGEKCPHTFLLHGPTGCGKTTIARIIANRLNSKGADLCEMDIGDFRGIDTVRDIRKQSQFMPIESEARVWILDECHKFTTDAQNALLKILEDTPPRVYFILCTTDPQKLLSTVKGRCSSFQVKPLSEEEMRSLLKRVVAKEGEVLDKEVYDLIIENNNGLPRNALQVLEQILNVDPEYRLDLAKKSEEQINQSIELCRILISPHANWKTVSSILNGLRDQDAEGIRRVVLGYCQSILLKADMFRAGTVLEAFIEPFYDSGFPALVLACYTVIKTK